MNLKGTTTSQELTYFGRRCIVQTIHHDSSLVGLRTIRTTWLDDAGPPNGGWPAGTITEKVIKGDGRKPGFKILSDTHVVKP